MNNGSMTISERPKREMSIEGGGERKEGFDGDKWRRKRLCKSDFMIDAKWGEGKSDHVSWRIFSTL